jgi:DNA-binding response OmpR family regulator
MPDAAPDLPRRPTVAVVDDDREVRQALDVALRAAGFDVRLAPHALKLVSALEIDRVSVIVLDVVNSWIDGLGLCRALKRNASYRAIPIVIISGRSELDAIRAAFSAGASAYFPKPLDVARLITKVRELSASAAS